MFKLIAVNYTVMLNGYSQWLNIKGEKLFYRDISSIDMDAAETSSWGQQREQSVGRVAGVIDDPPGPYVQVIGVWWWVFAQGLHLQSHQRC